jgi:hypothetical protein
MPRVLDSADLFYFKADIGQERNYFFTHEAFCRPVAYVNDAVRGREDLVFKQAIDRTQHLVVLVTIPDIAANERVVCVKYRFQRWYDYQGQSRFLCGVEYRLSNLSSMPGPGGDERIDTESDIGDPGQTFVTGEVVLHKLNIGASFSSAAE